MLATKFWSPGSKHGVTVHLSLCRDASMVQRQRGADQAAAAADNGWHTEHGDDGAAHGMVLVLRAVGPT